DRVRTFLGAARPGLPASQGMFVLYLTLGYVLSIGLWARPLISNETIQMRKKKKAAAAAGAA
ncbi:MAG: hypothetical protein NUW07_07710, partial [Candidatus Saccharicenans sp.]|nr:hypothetical protein [Candidatus Saccharicenans sp.]